MATTATARVRQVVDQHFDFTARSLRNLGVPPAELDDAVQQVFIVMWRKLDRVHPKAERSFLFQTAVRIASRARRTQLRRRETHNDCIGDQPSAEPRADELVDQGRARELADLVLSQLDIKLRTVFILFEVEQLSTAEIAELVGARQGTVKSRLRLAREQFERHVQRLRGTRGSHE